MSILQTLKEKRSKLTDSSLKTYNSILTNLYKKVFSDDKEIDLKKFEKTDIFLDFLKDTPIAKRKSYLSALVVLTDNEIYRKQMLQDATSYNELQKSQIKTEKQEANWLSQEELKETMDALQTNASHIMKQKQIKQDDIQQVQNYILLCLISGLYIPLRRLLDWSEMIVIHDEKKLTNDKNYLLIKKTKWTLHFHVYKTARIYGTQVVDVPKQLISILKKWIALKDTYYPDSEYLLIDVNGNKMTPTKLNQRIGKIFGRPVGINLIRRSSITDKYKDMPNLKQMIQDAEATGHSLQTHLEYIKR